MAGRKKTTSYINHLGARRTVIFKYTCTHRRSADLGIFRSRDFLLFSSPTFLVCNNEKEIERERARNGGGFSGPPLTYPNLVSGPSSSCNTHKNLDELSSIFKNQTTKSRTSVIRKNHQR